MGGKRRRLLRGKLVAEKEEIVKRKGEEIVKRKVGRGKGD